MKICGVTILRGQEGNVRVTKVSLQNVRCHQVLDLDFHSGLVALIGPNGAGKSSVLQAIAWAVFDHLPMKKADFIRHGQTEASAEVEFTHTGKVWTVKRKTAGTYVLFEGENPVANGRNDVVAYLQGVFSLGESVSLPALFKDAIGVGQGELTSGFSLSPVARQNFWGPVLRLDAYRRAFEKLRGPTKLLNDRVTAGRASVRALQDTLALTDFEGDLSEAIQEGESELASLETAQWEADAEFNRCQARREVVIAAAQERQTHQQRYEVIGVRLQGIWESFAALPEQAQLTAQQEGISKELSELDALLIPSVLEDYQEAFQARSGTEATVYRLADKAKAAEQQATEAKRLFDVLPAQQASLVDLRVQATALEQEVARQMQHIAAIDQDARMAEAAIPRLELGKPCPLCGAALSRASFSTCQAKLMEKVEAGKALPKLQAQLEEHQGHHARCLTQVGRLDFRIKQAPSASEVESLCKTSLILDTEHTAKKKALWEFCQKEEQLQKAKDEQIAYQASIDWLRRAASVLAEKIASVSATGDALCTEENRLVKEQEELEGKLSQPAPDEAGSFQALEEAVERSRSLSGQTAQQISWLEKLQQALEVQKSLEAGQSRLLRNEQLVEVLAECRGALAVAGPAVATQVMRKMSALADRYWQLMGNEQALSWSPDFLLSVGEQDFHQLSGGERVAAALAARMAVAQWMANLDFLVLDEPTVHLDEQARLGLAETLAALNLAQVIVVSHDQTFSSVSGQVIRFGLL